MCIYLCMCLGAAVAVPGPGRCALLRCVAEWCSATLRYSIVTRWAVHTTLTCPPLGCIHNPPPPPKKKPMNTERFVKGSVHVVPPCWSQFSSVLVLNNHNPRVLSPVRASAVHAGRDAESPGQQHSVWGTWWWGSVSAPAWTSTELSSNSRYSVAPYPRF
jgi:hypothetical protein